MRIRSLRLIAIGLFVFAFLALLALVFLAPIYRIETLWNCEESVPEEEIIGCWAQDVNSWSLNEGVNGKVVSRPQGALLLLGREGAFALLVSDGPESDYYAGDYFYSSEGSQFLGVFPVGYRNWIRFHFDSEGSPQFYALKNESGTVEIFRGSYNNRISSQALVRVDRVELSQIEELFETRRREANWIAP